MNTKKSLKLYLAILTLLISSFVYAIPQEKLRVAIMPFENLSQATGDPQLETLTGGMAESLITGLCRIQNLLLIERSQIKRIMEEQKLGLTGFIDETTAPETGKLLGANSIVLGSFQVFGNQIKINARIVDTETGVIDPTKTVSVRGKWTEDVFDLQDEIAILFIERFDVDYSNDEKDLMTSVLKSTDSYTAYDHYIRGRNFYLLLTKDGYEQAIIQFNKAIEIDSNYALAFTALAETYSLLGNWEKQRGNEYQKYFEKGIEYGKKAVSLNYNLCEAHRALANLYRNMLKIKDSEKEAKIAININPNDAESYVYVGISASIDEKINNLKKAINLNPNLTIAYSQLGAYYWMYNHDLDNAILNFKKCIEINPNSAEAYNNLGGCYLQKCFFDSAISSYDKAANLTSKDVTIFSNLGLVYFYKEKYDTSIENYEKALKINPNYSLALSGLAYSLFKKGEIEEATKQFKNAKNEFEILLGLDNRSNMSMFNRYNLGRVYIMLHNYEKAISLFKELLKYKIGDFRRAGAYYGLAGVYSMQNNNKKAFKNFEKAIKLGGNFYKIIAKSDPVFENIRDEDKFKELIAKSK